MILAIASLNKRASPNILWLKSQNIYHKEIANKLADLGPNTIRNSLKEYRVDW